MPVPVDEKLMTLYAQVAEIAGADSAAADGVISDIVEGLNAYPREWLLRVELLNAVEQDESSSLGRRLRRELETLAQCPEFSHLIQLALQSKPTSVAA
jgi:hypothetical protein